MIVPDDEMCIQQMLGIDAIPEDIEREYMIRARMLHRQLAGGAIGPIAVVDLLRALGYGPPPPQATDDEGRIVWRRVEQGTPVNVRVDGQWSPNGQNVTFQGEVGGGTIAVQWANGRIDEFNAFDVRLADTGLPSDVDSESFMGEADRPMPDARIGLIRGSKEAAIAVTEALDGEIVAIDEDSAAQEPTGTASEEQDDMETAQLKRLADVLDDDDDENEVETPSLRGDIGDDDEIPPHVPDTKINWGQVKKGTEVWLRDGEDMFDAKFIRCTGDGMASVHVDGEKEPREVERAFLKMP